MKIQYHYEAINQWGELPPIEDDDVSVNLILYMGDKRKRDADGHVKLVLDSLIGVCYKDDSQIKELTIIKEYSKENPRVEISII